MFALISDLHANLSALEAVLRRIEELGIPEVCCLGDLVGYGPDPEACIDLVRERCRFTLRGNHDLGCIEGSLHEFNPLARESLLWTRKRLRPRLLSPRSKRRWDFLAKLPERVDRDGMTFVHASPRDPIREYVLKSDGFLDPEKLEANFARIEGPCFVGHTHQPGFTTRDYRFHQATSDRLVWDLPQEPCIVNVGSVGQPRDGDPRACFLVVDEGRLLYQRVEYDLRRTQQRILEEHLSPYLAERLALGR
ncbi:MAG: metallophosphoesterase family protein [Planctomycetota bacterium]